MKKIIIGVILFLNFGITISNYQITVNAGSKIYAQRQGEIECPQHTGGNGLNTNWWTTFTEWIEDVIDDAIDFLGELFSGEFSGYETYYNSSLYYHWGQGGTLSYLDVYYGGESSYACFYSPSIFGGPYRGGRMWNCNGEIPRYEDCAFGEHNTDQSGIIGRSDEIAYLDECNECVGGSTGLPPCSSPLYYLKLQNGDTTKYYDGDTITIERGEVWVPITLYNEHGVTPPSVHWYPTCNYFYNEWFGYDLGNTFNLNISHMGDYTIPVSTGIIWAQTPITTNYLHVVRTDTVKPTAIVCDTLAIARDSIATSMLNQIATHPYLIQTRDSALGSHETSFSTYDSAGSTRVYPGSFKIGDTLHVDIYPKDTITGANHRNINSLWHLHHVGADYFPDPFDLFNLMMFRTLRLPTGPYGINNNYNPYLNHSFIVCDTSTDLAIVIYDTALAYQFIYLNHRDSVGKWDSVSNGPIYSSTYKGLPTPTGPRFNVSMRDDFDDAYRALKRRHYPEELARTYASVYMMQRYNMGIKTLMKVNGVFKELKVDLRRNRNGTIRTITVIICQ